MCDKRQWEAKPEQIYYRLLGHDVGHGASGTLARWQAENYSSKHDEQVPEEWIRLYFTSGLREQADFKIGERLHPDALEIFLKMAEKFDSREAWDQADLVESMPRAGVCAFATPKDVIAYAQGQFQGLHVATFRGSEIEPLPEKDGILVKVAEPIKLVSIAEFMQQHPNAVDSQGEDEPTEPDNAIEEFAEWILDQTPKLD